MAFWHVSNRLAITFLKMKQTGNNVSNCSDRSIFELKISKTNTALDAPLTSGDFETVSSLFQQFLDLLWVWTVEYGRLLVNVVSVQLHITVNTDIFIILNSLHCVILHEFCSKCQIIFKIYNYSNASRTKNAIFFWSSNCQKHTLVRK